MNNLKSISEIIKKNNKFLIVSHVNPDGDSIGSQLAMVKFLENIGKKVSILNNSFVPDIYRFLPGSSKIKTSVSDSEKFDVGLMLDASDESRLGEIEKEAIKKAPLVINIDHHASNNRFGEVYYLDQDAAATAIIIYKLIKLSGSVIDSDMANCLYVGISSDTGSFQFSNTNSEVHEIAADLIKLGASPCRIYGETHEIFNVPTIKLLGLAMLSLQMNGSGEIAWIKLRQKDFSMACAKPYETEGFINYLQMIKGVRAALFFREIIDKNNNILIKVSFRSKEGIDVHKIAGVFGGGGHSQAAGCAIEGDMDSVIKRVVSEVEKYI